MRKLMIGVTPFLLLSAMLLALPAMMLSDTVFAQESTVTINPTQGPAGTQVTGSGTNWAAGDQMQVSWAENGSILANTTVQSDGTFTVGFNIPSYAGQGGHNIYFTDLSSRYFLVAVFTVTTGQSQPTPGWYKNSGPATIYEDSSGLRILWENSYIYQHPGNDNLYWYAEVKYLNNGSQTVSLPCVGVADPSLAKEHIRGTEGIPPDGDGYVSADETFCSRNPNFTGSIKPGETQYAWAIFHNVPPGGEVTLEWGPYPFSPSWVNPWHSPFSASPPAECPPELVTLGTCVPTTPLIEKVNITSWAGYAATGAKNSPINFTTIAASWTVQPIKCSFGKIDEKSSYWVGLGGVNADLEQIGTYSFCLAGIPVYWGIWEIIIGKPNGAQFIDNPVTNPIYPGDRMEASVTILGKGKYQLTLRNNMRNWTWSEVKEGSTEQTAVQTAECIVELPNGALSDFGKFTFEGCKADDKSLLMYPRLYQFTMMNDKTEEPSKINSNSDFTITWKHE